VALHNAESGYSKIKVEAFIYSIHAFKRSAIKRRNAFMRSAKSATQLLFFMQIVTFKWRIAY